VAAKRINEWAYDVLAGDGGTKSAGQIAEAMLRAGYEPRGTKNEGQLRRSVWVALSRDARVKKVGPGTFALKTSS
jgi:hypothetical protein